MMEEWKRRLGQADDDYLTALSNKGIVKRAYKDRRECAGEIVDVGVEASVKVGGETVTVRFPFGESGCTCPSRSICRHVVQAILILRESCLGTGETGEKSPAHEVEAGQEGGSFPDRAAVWQEGGSFPAHEVEVWQEGGSLPAHEAGGWQEGGKSPDPSAGGLPDGGRDFAREGLDVPESAVVREVCAYPLGALKKALGSRNLRNLADFARAGLGPAIRYSSVITVELPEWEFPDKRVVRLLSPLEHSSCTCHKKGLCAHKAAAILWCRLSAEVLSVDDLDVTGAKSYDTEDIRSAAGQMKDFLEELFGTGLSRVSPGVTDALERLAVISHNAGLAGFEGEFRALADSYNGYLKRKAAFGTRELMERTGRLYRRVDVLLGAQGVEALRQAGDFRAEYLPAGDLELIGVAMERFRSRKGYEGETVYFLEEKTKRWYTYTDARPTFYGGEKREGPMGKSPAPWGLATSLERLSEVRVRLAGAKCDDRGRLSSGRDTKAEITSEREIGMRDIQEWYYEDFGKLFRERIGKREQWIGEISGDAPRLVFVRPDSCAGARFSTTRQQSDMYIYDKAGREIVIEVAYSKKESDTIRRLEKIPPGAAPCFLGKIYLRDGRIRMYPVDVWEKPPPGM